MHERLGHKQTAAMFTLLALAREVTNPELNDLVGFTLTGADRRALAERDFVISRKKGQFYVHELTERGREWCRAELGADTPPPPRARSVLVPALYEVLSGFSAYLQREQLKLGDVFWPDVELTTEEIENRIQASYRKLARSPRDWVGLVDLRPMLGNVPAKEVDQVLKALSLSGRAHLIPESNRKVLTAADHAAAIRIGGEDNHLISIEAS